MLKTSRIIYLSSYRGRYQALCFWSPNFLHKKQCFFKKKNVTFSLYFISSFYVKITLFSRQNLLVSRFEGKKLWPRQRTYDLLCMRHFVLQCTYCIIIIVCRRVRNSVVTRTPRQPTTEPNNITAVAFCVFYALRSGFVHNSRA